MFRGQFTHAIDAKGRVSIPSKFREVLNGRGQQTLVITNSLDPCLLSFPMDAWMVEEKRIQSLPDFDAQALQYKRFFIAGAQECVLDGQGRILIPPNLREYAQLEREVLFAGLLEKFELWSPDLWQAKPEDPEALRKVLKQHLSAGPSALSDGPAARPRDPS